MSTVEISYAAAVHAVEVGAIILTISSGVAAAAVLCLVLFDNYRQKNTWTRLSRQRRTPFYLAISIFLSQVAFGTREFLETGSILSDASQGGPSGTCIVANEVSWWAIWFPLLALAVRVCFIAGEIIFKYNSFSRYIECAYAVLVVALSIALWTPSYLLTPTLCSSFVMFLSVDKNLPIGLTGTAFLCGFFTLICVSLIVIAWDVSRSASHHSRTSSVKFILSNLNGYRSSESEGRSAKKGAIYYGLGIFCLYACLLPNFAITAFSRFSEPAIYVSSIAIHMSGIVLLIQYLFARHTCRRCYSNVGTISLGKETARSDKPSSTLRGSFSESMVSDEIRRIQQRSQTAASGGDDCLRRESNSSVESAAAVTLDKVGNTKKFAKSKSFEGISSKSSPSIFDNEKSSTTSTALTDDPDEKASDKVSRQASGRRTRRGLDQIQSKNDDVTNNTSSQGYSNKDLDGPTSVIETRESTLMPVLQQPLSDSLRPTSALGKRSEMETFTYRHAKANDDPEQFSYPSLSPEDNFSNPLASPDSDKSTSPNMASISPGSPGFRFPFRSKSNGLSHMVEYEEEFSDWKPGTLAASMESNDDDDYLEHQQSWPFQLEDLVRPDPPFASEDRFMYPTSSESRLSTITEEGTIRSSVATPQNITASEVPAKTAEGSVAATPNTIRLRSSLGSWFTQNGTRNNVEHEMKQDSV